MEPINGLEKLARLLRSKAGAKTSRAERQGVSSATPSKRGASLSSQGAMEQELRIKVKQLTKLSASPQTIGQAVIGTMLAWEFDDALYSEPKFNALVQQVYRHIESEPKIKAAFQQIIDQLNH